MVRHAHLAEVFQEIAANFGDRTALSDARGRLTYTQFCQAILNFGHGLGLLGLNAGDRVGLLMSDHREYLIADYGAMTGGFVRVPLDTRLSDSEMLAQLQLSNAAALVTEADFAPRAAALRQRLPGLRIVSAAGPIEDAVSIKDLLAAITPAREPTGSPDDLAALNFSGGSTGRPKATAITHRNLATVLDTVPRGFAIEPDDVFLNVRPLWPIAQVITMSYFAAGAQVVLGGRFDPATFADLVAASGATRSSLVPTQLLRALDHIQRTDPRLRGLEAIHVGGSRIPPTTFARTLDLLGPRIGVLYGLTEAPVTTYLSPADFAAAGDFDAMLALTGASGRILGDYDVRLGGGGGPAAGDLGPSGEILIRGGHVMSGYWKEPEMTAEALQDGWLHTSDLGAFDAAGRLHVVGRLKEVIRSGASSILPKEVEDAIAVQDGVEEVAVLGLPDEEWGEIVVAFVVPGAGATLDPSLVIANCDARLARFKRPKRVFLVDEIPRSHYGKVLRPKLLEKLKEASFSGP